MSKHLPALALFCVFDRKNLPTEVHVRQNVYIRFNDGASAAVYVDIVETVNLGIIGVLVIVGLLAGNIRGDGLVLVDVALDV